MNDVPVSFCVMGNFLSPDLGAFSSFRLYSDSHPYSTDMICPFVTELCYRQTCFVTKGSGGLFVGTTLLGMKDQAEFRRTGVTEREVSQ